MASLVALDQNNRDAEYLRDMKDMFVEKKEHMDQDCLRFVERVRETILDANQNGDFLTLGICPAVLTDNFFLQASSFFKSGIGIDNDEPVVVGYWHGTSAAIIQDTWLLAKRGSGGGGGGQTKLALLSYPSKNANHVLFPKLLDDVIVVFQEFFPVVVKRDTYSVVPETNTSQNVGMELTAALQRAQELRQRGAMRKILPNAIRVTDAQVHLSMPVVHGTVVVDDVCEHETTKTTRRVINNPTLLIIQVLIVAALCLYFLHVHLFPLLFHHHDK